MSTRAQILIKKDGQPDILVYRHSDGFPSSCGEDVKRIVKEADFNPEDIIKGMENSISEYTKRSYYYVEKDNCGYLGNLEWFYVVDCDNQIHILLQIDETHRKTTCFTRLLQEHMLHLSYGLSTESRRLRHLCEKSF